VHVAALVWFRSWLLAVLDAGELTNAVLLTLDVDKGLVNAKELYSAAISDEVAIMDDYLYLFGRGDLLHPAGIEWLDPSGGGEHWIDAAALGVAEITAVFFAEKGFWVAAVDVKGTSNARWIDYDGDEDPVFESDVPLGDIAAEGRTGLWATVDDGRTLRHLDYAGKQLGEWTFPAPVAIRSCGADAL
jgi:hypothetical protein